jgi:hypothetical protein
MRLSDSSGKTLLGLNMDPYDISFRLVRVHALLPGEAALDPSSLGNALRSGHCFIGFDLLGDTTGFSFVASNSKERRVQGDEIGLLEEVKFTVTSPVPSRIILIKNGVNFQEGDGFTRQEFVVRERGVYRVEVYLPQLSHRAAGQPWIISNPIYVR